MLVEIQEKEATKSFFGLASETEELMAKVFPSLIKQTFSPKYLLRSTLKE